MIPTSRRMTDYRLRSVLNKTVALSGLLAALFAAPAFADEFADVSKLMRANQYAEALNKADAYLRKNPRDAQMRFIKGVILTEQNKSSEAIAIFTKLTEDFPSLPEPYNNLAVLYAAAGQYDKARNALDAAIRTNPSYATAYENLGDVHAKLASQAYDKALQLDSRNSATKSKLTLVRSLVGNANGNANTTVVAAAPALPNVPAPSAPVAAAPAAKAPAPAATTPAAPAADTKVAAVTPPPAPVAKPAPPEKVAVAKPEPVKPAPKPTSSENAEREEILDVVQDWAKAWSSRDVKAYLGHYGSDFQVPNGQPRKAWEEERRARIAGKGSINVKVEAPQVSVNGNAATVKFRQVYVSDRLTANTRKTLVLAKQGGKWRIRQENTGS
ncbi:MAG TPA: tetratricopeptide repeat protein [Noviherbaspirillum sp.]|nr:tetratricopeptide repeat protein [Noviherbaspirillum sp.]